MTSEAEKESNTMDSTLILLFLIESECYAILVAGPGHVARDWGTRGEATWQVTALLTTVSVTSGRRETKPPRLTELH